MAHHTTYMARASELAKQTAFVDKCGGPFGCVIVRDGEIIGEGANRVLVDGDPTSHGEVVAIRAACAATGSHDLSGCTLYSSCEPCPMCYAAAWWARIDRIYYAATIQDAMEYGNFDDVSIYEAVAQPAADRVIPALEVDRAAMVEVWKAFRDMPDRPHY